MMKRMWTEKELEEHGGGGGNVLSVNGKTGVVVLDAEDVGALPSSTSIPTKTSELTNDSGFLTEHQSLANYSTTSEMNSAISAHHDSSKQDTLTAGNGISIVNNVISATGSYSKVEFISTSTTKLQIDAIIEANKIPILIADNKYWYLERILSNAYVFLNIDGAMHSTQSCDIYGWTANSQNYQNVNQLVTSISAGSTNIQYPSAKCVYDAIQEIQVSSIYWCTYDETSYATIGQNITNNILPVVKFNDRVYICVGQYNDLYYFICPIEYTNYYITVDSDSDWTSTYATYENSANRLTSYNQSLFDSTHYISGAVFATALNSLMNTPKTNAYGSTLPTTGTTGQIFYKLEV